MEKFMAAVMAFLGKWIARWELWTGLPTSAYEIGGKRFTVNWAMVALVSAFWGGLALVDWLIF